MGVNKLKLGSLSISGFAIGSDEVDKIYLYNTLIYEKGVEPAVLTGISISISSVSDVPSSGGTVTSANCIYIVTGLYSDGTTSDVTSLASVSGSLSASSSYTAYKHPAGVLTLTASYEGFTSSGSINVNQEAYVAQENYLEFEIISAGTIVWKATRASIIRTIEYSKNGGAWTQITSSTGGTSINVVASDKVRFRGNNTNYGTLDVDTYVHSGFGTSTASFNLRGNIMSLVAYTNYATAITLYSAYTFESMFENAKVIHAGNGAFALPATNLKDRCYGNMFYGCSSLASAPDLPATTLTNRCYGNMFRNCTSLTTAPSLPSTTIALNCYNGMFYGCSNLTTAPELPAPTLASYCYASMFYNCSKLKRIKCLATNRSASGCLNSWVSGVSGSGTFERSDTSWTSRGVSNIPSGWTIVTVNE